MKKITYTVTERNGLHARPAGILVKLCNEFSSEILISTINQVASGKKLFALMNLCVKYGDEISVSISGIDEDTAAQVLQEFLYRHL